MALYFPENIHAIVMQWSCKGKGLKAEKITPENLYTNENEC